ncbi:MAG TPA: putative quinol monooxygenase [Propionibacteriaceae bacterium]|nr:putative quinol monooxygenase [Propionibacteriaceae bacterium]
MIFIVVKWPVRPEHSDNWLSVVDDFTQGTRSEPGNLFFEWSRSADDNCEWVLVEGFRDGEAGSAHVNSEHFKAAIATLPDYVSATPKIISKEIDVDGWGEMAEVQPRS